MYEAFREVPQSKKDRSRLKLEHFGRCRSPKRTAAA